MPQRKTSGRPDL